MVSPTAAHIISFLFNENLCKFLLTGFRTAYKSVFNCLFKMCYVVKVLHYSGPQPCATCRVIHLRSIQPFVAFTDTSDGFSAFAPVNLPLCVALPRAGLLSC